MEPTQRNHPALTLAEEFGGDRLLLSDLRVAFLLMNQARLRAIARLLGVSPERANLVTLVVVLASAEAAGGKVQQLLSGPAVPSFGDGLWAGVSVRELLCAVAGPSAHAAPLLGTLLAIAVVGGAAGPVAVKSLRAIGASSHRATVGFHHRYGYLVDPGHWRERRAQRARTGPVPTGASLGGRTTG